MTRKLNQYYLLDKLSENVYIAFGGQEQKYGTVVSSQTIDIIK